tara:strand:+ start:520 stop:1245 length:726 start_codon:yes stop_codon:yes gene_type:complete
MDEFIKKILMKISRAIYHLTPIEFRNYIKKKDNEGGFYNIYKNKAMLECFNYFEKHFNNSLHLDNVSIRQYAIERSLLNDKEKKKFYLEFGVWKGQSANFFAQYLDKLYAFDSFEGLKEDWVGTEASKNHFSLNKKIPKLNKKIEPIIGFIQDTLTDFLEKNNPEINFVHFDMDTYESTKYALEKIKPFLNKGAVIIFDELYNFPGWRHGEFKALQETFDENDYTYKAFAKNSGKVVVQLK